MPLSAIAICLALIAANASATPHLSSKIGGECANEIVDQAKEKASRDLKIPSVGLELRFVGDESFDGDRGVSHYGIYLEVVKVGASPRSPAIALIGVDVWERFEESREGVRVPGSTNCSIEINPVDRKDWTDVYSLYPMVNSDQNNHFRFWRGFKQSTSTFDQFKSHVAMNLVPATRKVGLGKGLVSYLPVFIDLGPRTKPASVPDEVAIIQYESLESYKILAATPEFAEYGKMHYEAGAFARVSPEGFKSGSLVSTVLPPAADIKIDPQQAAAFHLGNVGGPMGSDRVNLNLFEFIGSGDRGACSATFLKNLSALSAPRARNWGALVVVDPNYILAYEIAGDGANGTRPLRLASRQLSCLRETGSIPLQNACGFSSKDLGLNMRIDRSCNQ